MNIEGAGCFIKKRKRKEKEDKPVIACILPKADISDIS